MPQQQPYAPHTQMRGAAATRAERADSPAPSSFSRSPQPQPPVDPMDIVTHNLREIANVQRQQQQQQQQQQPQQHWQRAASAPYSPQPMAAEGRAASAAAASSSAARPTYHRMALQHSLRSPPSPQQAEFGSAPSYAAPQAPGPAGPRSASTRDCLERAREGMRHMEDWLAFLSSEAIGPAEAAQQDQADSLALMKHTCANLRADGEWLKGFQADQFALLFKDCAVHISELESVTKRHIGTLTRTMKLQWDQNIIYAEKVKGLEGQQLKPRKPHRGEARRGEELRSKRSSLLAADLCFTFAFECCLPIVLFAFVFALLMQIASASGAPSWRWCIAASSPCARTIASSKRKRSTITTRRRKRYERGRNNSGPEQQVRGAWLADCPHSHHGLPLVCAGCVAVQFVELSTATLQLCEDRNRLFAKAAQYSAAFEKEREKNAAHKSTIEEMDRAASVLNHKLSSLQQSYQAALLEATSKEEKKELVRLRAEVSTLREVEESYAMLERFVRDQEILVPPYIRMCKVSITSAPHAVTPESQASELKEMRD